jgi:quercetin dioxygenase-like cupin family protein
LTVGEESQEIDAGDGWHAPPNVPHGGEVLGKEEAVFIDVYSPGTLWIMDQIVTGRTTSAKNSE